MKKMTVACMSAVLVALALGVNGWAVNQAGEDTHWGMAGRRHGADRLLTLLESDRVKQMLNLTDDQAARLRQITVQAEKTGIETRAALAVRKLELRELLRGDNPDRDAVLKKVQEISTLSAQSMKQRVEALLDAKAVLTPEQQKKIRELRASRRLNQEGMRGQWPGMAGGPGPGRRPMPPNQGPPRPAEPPVQ
jgi:Spy/CpxP family protein refolding chaperone